MSFLSRVYLTPAAGRLYAGGMHMLRRLHPRCSLWLNAALALFCAAAFLLVLLWPLRSFSEATTYTAEERALLDAFESGEIIRLHVLADGDDAESQRVKLCVRDALIAAFGDLLVDASHADADAVYETLLAQVSRMEEVALTCARENGFTGPVTAEAGVLTLPEKTYGQVTLPAGDYRGLRVTLGSGQGRNWWCVLFPQLCLAVSSDGVEPQPSEVPSLTWDAERILSQWLIFPV